MLLLLFLLVKIFFICLPIILAVYFTFSKKHKDEGTIDIFDDGYHPWWD